MQIRVLPGPKSALGESPLWHPTEEAIYWLDIRQLLVHRRDRTGDCASWKAREPVTAIALDKAGRLVGTHGASIARLTLTPGGAVEVVAIFADANLASNVRFNDGAVAPDGAFWAGTMDDHEVQSLGRWCRLGRDGVLEWTATEVGVTNGPVFDNEKGHAFLTDSRTRTIYRAEAWTVAAFENAKLYRCFTEAEGAPDGMALDRDGLLWVAFWDGGCVRQLDPATGGTIRRIDLPIRRPTSCAFGGAGLDRLFVTSAFGGEDGAGPDGALLVIDGLDTIGRPADRYVAYAWDALQGGDRDD